MKLRARALGLAIGLVLGVGTFIGTFLSLLKGGGLTLSKLGLFFFGYTVSFGGAFVGLIWGFIYGFVCGALVALLYNAFHKMLYKKEGSAA